jgi:hypothetical protein
MKFLVEREAGYAADGIGFPSISGCLAVAYQTSGGLFGFHNAGNSAADKFDARAKKWADFVRAHPNGADAGVCLYGVTFARANERGYAGPPVERWKEELKTFALRLGFRGPILGHDLTISLGRPGGNPPAYVLFRREGGGYSIFVREWFRDARDGLTTMGYAASADYKNLDSTTMTKTVKDVSHAGLIRVYPERLGGL